MSICTSITKVDTLPDGTDVLSVVIDNDVQSLWFYSEVKAMEFVGKDVIAEYRSDVYKGNLERVISTFTMPTRINTLDKKENIRLYCDQVDNNANLIFDEVELGEAKMGCIVYCVSCEYKSSPNAVWMEMLIRDKKMHVAKLRIFDYANKEANFAGQYIMTELSRNAYGFQSTFAKPVTGEVPTNPEIDIAKQFIMNYFADDAVSLDYISTTRVLDFLSETIDYEQGYGLMRLAMELSMVDNLVNITRDIDVSAIGRALLASRGHITRTSAMSSVVNNVNIAAKFMWDNRRNVMLLLDIPGDDPIPEVAVMKSIQDTVDHILEIRKGVPKC